MHSFFLQSLLKRCECILVSRLSKRCRLSSTNIGSVAIGFLLCDIAYFIQHFARTYSAIRSVLSSILYNFYQKSS